MSVPGLLFNVLPHFFYRQLFVTPPKPESDCSGKTIIVTGANVGLGKEAARHYVRLNAVKVILACRSLEKGQAAVKDIEATTKRTGVLEVWALDLSSYESVKRFAERAKSLRRIDSLVENAGISTSRYKAVEGNESTGPLNTQLLQKATRLPYVSYRECCLNILTRATHASQTARGCERVQHHSHFVHRQLRSTLFHTGSLPRHHLPIACHN